MRYCLTKNSFGSIDLWKNLGHKWRFVKRLHGTTNDLKNIRWPGKIDNPFVAAYIFAKGHSLDEMIGTASMEAMEPRSRLVTPGVETKEIDNSNWLTNA